jgi:hypothetical protein
LNEVFIASGSSLVIAKEHLVSLPVPTSLKSLNQLSPLILVLNSKSASLIVGLTIAIVASIETLLSIEAADRMDAEGTNTILIESARSWKCYQFTLEVYPLTSVGLLGLQSKFNCRLSQDVCYNSCCY